MIFSFRLCWASHPRRSTSPPIRSIPLNPGKRERIPSSVVATPASAGARAADAEAATETIAVGAGFALVEGAGAGVCDDATATGEADGRGGACSLSGALQTRAKAR
jgi:hypothetical protein